MKTGEFRKASDNVKKEQNHLINTDHSSNRKLKDLKSTIRCRIKGNDPKITNKKKSLDEQEQLSRKKSVQTDVQPRKSDPFLFRQVFFLLHMDLPFLHVVKHKALVL